MNLKTSCAKIRAFYGLCKFSNELLNIFNNFVTFDDSQRIPHPANADVETPNRSKFN